MKRLLALLVLTGCVTVVPAWLDGQKPVMTNVPAGSSIDVPGYATYRVEANSTLLDDRQFMDFMQDVKDIVAERDRLLEILEDTFRHRGPRIPKGIEL